MRPNTVFLDLESLDLRCLPAGDLFLWFPTTTDYNWSTVIPAKGTEAARSNWKISENNGVTWQYTSKVPGEHDEARFNGSSDVANSRCNIDIEAKIHKLQVFGGYSKIIHIDKSLTIAGVDENNAADPTSMLWLNSPTATISGAGKTHGDLVIAGAGLFDWHSGGLLQVDVDVRRDESVPAKCVISADPDGLTGAVMTDTKLDIKGILEWKDQSLIVGSTVKYGSAVHIAAVGEFEISASGKTMGTRAAKNVAEFQVVNDGIIRMNLTEGKTPEGKPAETKAATINGDYYTSGTTELGFGVLELGGLAEQSDPGAEFRILAKTTVKISTTSQILGIRDGKITGDGTVDGRLSIGNDPDNPNYNPAIHSTNPIVAPGDTKDPTNTLNVTNQFRMYSGELQIQIAGKNDYDRVVVGNEVLADATPPGIGPGGKAIGTLFPTASVPAGTKVQFLTSTNSKVIGDFVEARRVPPAGWNYGQNEDAHWFELGEE